MMSTNASSELSHFPMGFAATERPRIAASLSPIGLLAAIREHVRRKNEIYRLSRLGDRDLADMGVTRTEVSQIYEPDFAERRRT
jgi:uncharacterized protein YjiS (DUF1127 family)